jgi:MFS family permease
MSTPAPAPAAPRPSLSGLVLGALLLAAAAILFYLVYAAFPAHDHFGGLLGIGILSLVFALGTYFAEALSREPVTQRAISWAFFGLGFAVLFLTIAIGPTYGALTAFWQLLGLLLTIVVLIVAVALISWRTAALRRTAQRMVSRKAWEEEPAPSAFSYATARSPDTPVVPVTPPSAPPAGSAPPMRR